MSKNEMQMIRSLKNKKERNEHGLFVVEGLKAVKELLASRVKTRSVYAVKKFDDIKTPVIIVSDGEFAKMSSMKSPQGILACAEKPSHKLSVAELKNELTLALCGIRDPGNMGSIIRAADWFGIKNVVCSSDTCDIYNPKAIAAAMGSAFRVKVHYTDPVIFLSEAKEAGITIYASTTDGGNIYEAKLSPRGIIIIGNESKGIAEEIKALAGVKISIPSFGEAESLNAALAAAAICSEFRRRKN
ncbi:MAG: RNA methyltransferase [Elusimicrobiota bacterium]|nr:RNA methyltransferase [Elusimicrobiota bacterium]